MRGFMTVNLQLKKCGRGDSNSHTSRHQILSLAYIAPKKHKNTHYQLLMCFVIFFKVN